MSNLGIYIHIPFCRSKCNYCAFNSFTADIETQKTYIKHLLEEIKKYDGDKYADTVYIGGGTPSFLYGGGIESVLEEINSKFSLKKNAEITIEGNPESLSLDKLKSWYHLGVNRLSIGLQSASDKVSKNAGRVHNFADFLRAIENADKANFCNVNCDIMLGLPIQTMHDIKDTISQIINFDIIKHISAYGLKAEEGTPWKSLIINEDLSADMYDLAYKMLLDNGFLRYEVSNFARTGYRSRHNINYWRRGNYIGFGLGAHSLIDNVRYANPDKTEDYYAGKKQKAILTPTDIKEEYIMLAFRMDEGIDIKDYNQTFETDFLENYKKIIDKLFKFLNISQDRISIKPQYMGVMNSIITEFFD